MAKKQSLIQARRRLSELFKLGVEVRFGGRYGLEGEIAPLEGELAGKGPNTGYFVTEAGDRDELQDGEVALWIQPPSPIQRDMALRNANSARSRATLQARKDEESEEYLAAVEFIDEMVEDTLYEYLLVAKTDERQQDAIREILADEEWSDITELQESKRIFEEEGRSADDPEVKRVAARERELQIQVATREQELRDAAGDVLRMGGYERARKEALEHHVEILCSRAFMVEYERQMTYFSVRDIDDTNTLFFDSARELAESPDELLDLIQKALTNFIKDGSEAKNSPRAARGSASSAPPSKPETSESSTPED